eukprot:CAMPEP_0177733990 /NCGR_PEP_ID=MMETSP0484_2-20121128/23985_1 /TAXON_ID=354590 /ORGANISM="Rhodomonas lens, Strain RHODO" /LENGTH=37 /DNA_ID= /DNA_START= /DNA_END= /DNA_ORIENTATION=
MIQDQRDGFPAATAAAAGLETETRAEDADPERRQSRA